MMENCTSAKDTNDWQTPAYKTVKKSALFCANTLVLKPCKNNKLKNPFAMLHSDVSSLSPTSLRWTVISFLVAIAGEKASSLGLPKNIKEGVIKNAWFCPERRELQITCTSLYFKRALKRIVNKAPILPNTTNNASSPHFLVARDHIPDASHRLYHRACKVVRQLIAHLFKEEQLHSAWISPACYMLNNKPVFVPRIVLSWYDNAPQTNPADTPFRVSLLLHPGVKKGKAHGNIARRVNAQGPTLQLESRLNLFPRQYSAGPHWEKLFVASIKRSLSAADLACSDTPFPLPPSRLGDFLNPSAPFYSGATCLTLGSSVRVPKLPSPAVPTPNLVDKEVPVIRTPSPSPPATPPAVKGVTATCTPYPPPPSTPSNCFPDSLECVSVVNNRLKPSPPPPPPSSADESMKLNLTATEWPTLEDARSVRPSKALSPVVADSGSSKSRLPTRSLSDFFTTEVELHSLDSTPRRSARLLKKAAGPISDSGAHCDNSE